MINKIHQVRVASVATPVVVSEELKQPSFNIVNTYTKSVEEDGVIKWYLYLVNYDEQVFKFRLDFYE
jgi:hypothetical protein